MVCPEHVATDIDHEKYIGRTGLGQLRWFVGHHRATFVRTPGTVKGARVHAVIRLRGSRACPFWVRTS